MRNLCTFFFTLFALHFNGVALPTNSHNHRANAVLQNCISGWISRINDYCIYPGQSETCLKFPRIDNTVTHDHIKRLATKCCHGQCEISEIDGACCRTADCLPQCYSDFQMPHQLKANDNNKAKIFFSGNQYVEEDED
ncbi:hypothetical protein M3Y98_01130900 [Aphelenchoides besseyi]|nr:hypothetical protein M3Y98_01130900 [Aphelenchoides besseyi]KAI6210587.1 hypothetical protein M3Y96_00344000 [Aphelenchoides besseyi]